VHVNRSLQALRRKQLISFQSGHVAILDWEGLKLAGEFESRYLHVGRDAGSGRRKMARESGSPEVR
jgi:hypothetical protein